MPALPNRPCGRSSSTATRMTKATAARHSAPMSCTESDFRQPDDEPRQHGARHAADAAQYGGGEERQQKVMAHVRADLHEEPRHHACDRRKGRAQQPDDADGLAHIDTGECRKLLVLAHRAHGAADGGAREEQMNREDEECRHGRATAAGRALRARQGRSSWRSAARR